MLNSLAAYAIKRGGTLQRVVRNSGVNFKTPFLEKGKKFRVSNYKLKVANKTFNLNYSINPKYYSEFYQAYGDDHGRVENMLETFINTQVSKLAKAKTSKQDAEKLIQNAFNTLSKHSVGKKSTKQPHCLR